MAAVALRRPVPNNLPIYPISSTGLTVAHARLGVPVRKKVQASDSILCQQTPAVNPAWGMLFLPCRLGNTTTGTLWGALRGVIRSGPVGGFGGHRRAGGKSGNRSGPVGGFGKHRRAGGEKPGLR